MLARPETKSSSRVGTSNRQVDLRFLLALVTEILAPPWNRLLLALGLQELVHFVVAIFWLGSICIFCIFFFDMLRALKWRAVVVSLAGWREEFKLKPSPSLTVRQ